MTTTAVTTAPKTTRSAPRSLAALTANYAINDTLVAFRNVAFISFTVALPIVMFLVFRMMFANQDFANSDVHHDTVFYEGTPAATTTRLRGEVEGAGYVLSLGLRKTF